MTSKTSGLEPVKCWRLDCGERTAAFASFSNGIPALIAFGPRLPRQENLESVARATVPNVSAGQLDPLVPLTLCPTSTDGWQGHPGVVFRAEGGNPLLPDWQIADVNENGPHAIQWIMEGSGVDVAITLTIRVELCNTGVLSVQIDCQGSDEADLQWLAPAVPVPDHMPRIVDHGGRWTGEFQRQEHRFTLGQYVRESFEGRTGHAHFPGMTFAADACDENSGACMGVSLAWSGGHKIVAEELPDGRRQVQCGYDAATTGYKREMLVAVSEDGFNGLLQQWQQHVRTHIVRHAARPVHYNCWEAVYFRHDVEELKEIATIAADLGAERFVLDDGWFKNRNDDTTSLGDWTVDQAKYPDGLGPLVDHITGLGMRFGIWFEPEMVNKNSDLYRAHPDWVLGPDHQPEGRNQHVLDLTKPGVTDYLYENIAAILQAYAVDYVKWDHNRVLTGAKPQQTVALYALFERLNKAFPKVDFESCSSGGGRIDYGILNYTTRVWLSDSNDALERLRMQHEAARWLPPEIAGSHVGPRVCHTSGRVLPMEFRAWVAAQRHMGFEMDPRELTQDEAETLKRVTAWWRENRDFLFSARQYLLDSNDEAVFAELHVDEARDRFILFKGQAGTSGPIAARRMRLAGLSPDALYDITLINPEDVTRLLNRYEATGLMKGETIRLSGSALMNGGLRLPNAVPASIFVVEGRKVRS
ncbi:alpha-galactosidase [Rhizobium sp. L1K21]|uniref:alpha-galactosidase n=1 Tax=Rhizobium sp. L1K21 TaxID=2954933 RepID=UPI0020940032|nr:alpha-galactosidase [Rhizobium sp. L1K21]MCO6187677.1 alpha-galactosidase [Rhizobium sp. L1K21]